MTAGNKFFDDMSKLMTNAMGVAQGAKTEAETAMKGFVDRWIVYGKVDGEQLFTAKELTVV